jgi:hypothetical protein
MSEHRAALGAESEHRKVHRFNVNFSEGAYRDLTTLAERQGKTLAQVLRDAIALCMWFQSVEDEGGKVLVERPNGRVAEVLQR